MSTTSLKVLEFVLPTGDTLRLQVHDPRPWVQHWEKLPAAMRLFALTMAFFVSDPTELVVFDRWVENGGKLDETITWGPQSIVTHDLSGPDMFVDMAGMIRALLDRGIGLASIREHLSRIRVGIALDHAQESQDGDPDADIKAMYGRNIPRLELLRWTADFLGGQLWPSTMGICHQIIQEYWGELVGVFRDGKRVTIAEGLQDGDLVTPESTLVLDSHASNGGGFFQFIVGGGGPRALRCWFTKCIKMVMPQVTGVRLVGELQPGVDAKSLVAALTDFLGNDRTLKGSAVEYFGPGLNTLSTADRCTIANQGPEYGAFMVIVRFGQEVLNHLSRTGRSPELIALVEQYFDYFGFTEIDDSKVVYTTVREFDLSTVVAQAATNNQPKYATAISGLLEAIRGFCLGKFGEIYNAHQLLIAIAAITSCTSTGNPRMMVEAGLVAKAADEAGLRVPAWVKAMLAPGSASAPIYLARLGLLGHFDNIGFGSGGIACTYCLGKSGTLYQALKDKIAQMAAEGTKTLSMAVTSSNRPFNKRIHKEVDINTNLSPAWVVIFALKGYIFDPINEPLAVLADGRKIFARDLFPSAEAVAGLVEQIGPDDYAQAYSPAVIAGDEQFRSIPPQNVDRVFDPGTGNYLVSIPDYSACKRFAEDGQLPDIFEARCLGRYGDALTTDGLAPNFSIIEDSPMWDYLIAEGMPAETIRQYTISDFRAKDTAIRKAVLSGGDANNLMVGGQTGRAINVLTEVEDYLYNVAMQYDEAGVAKFIMAENDYGSGSSRVWGVKGLTFANVPLVLSRNTDPIHSQNLVDMAVVNVQFLPGETPESLGLTGFETYRFNFGGKLEPGQVVPVEAVDSETGDVTRFDTQVAIKTVGECQTIVQGGFIGACVDGADEQIALKKQAGLKPVAP